MIKYFDSFLTDDECDYFISFFDLSKNYNDDDTYRFYYVDLIKQDLKISKFSNFKFKKFRVQMVNETINQVKKPHGHSNPWSFITFLNDDFIGGEIIFHEKTYKPKKGDMIYFSGKEIHQVNNCVGNRYTLVGFMLNNPLLVEDNSYFI
jgi:hypothetical protein